MQKDITIHVPSNDNPLLDKIQEKVNENTEIQTLWKIINVNAIDRLNMPDHGPVHFQIVANIALRLARILEKKGIDLSIQKDFELSHDHGELVIFLASIMHDLGMVIEREGHEGFSLIIASRLMDKMLDFLPEEEKTIITAEVLHAIISHRSGGRPLTLEAGIVRVSDALDLSEGRSRIPYSAGVFDIHSVSAAAIDSVKILEGDTKPVKIEISMNNSSGVFQVDELLKKKLKNSGLEKHVSIIAKIEKSEEKSLVKEVKIDL